MRSSYIAAIAIVLIIAVSACILIYEGQQHTAAATHAAAAVQRYNQTFCVNGLPQNYTALGIASSNGIDCFRTDISFTPQQLAFVSNATADGAQYLGILDYNTVGAQISDGACASGCNWTLATWNASVANAVREYPGVTAWEIWNEPLASLFASGYDNGSALNYFNMIRSASTIIKAHNPNATVVCFGGAELYPLQEVEYEYEFYSQVWQLGAAKYCDAISVHVYSLPYDNLNQTLGEGFTLGMFYNATLNVYENMTHKPIWITETGIPSNNFTAGLNLSEQDQASFLNQDMQFFSKYPFVRRIYWFDFWDSPGGTQDYGLLNGSLQPKPAWYSFVRFVGNSTENKAN